jgi:formylglycine-generating enzyme required for sulfatase activity
MIFFTKSMMLLADILMLFLRVRGVGNVYKPLVRNYCVNRNLSLIALFAAFMAMIAAPTRAQEVAQQSSEAKTVQDGSTFRDCANCPQMTVIPAGHFLMGLSKRDEERDISEIPPEAKARPLGWLKIVQHCMDQEMPQHPVTISRPFALGTYPVTRKEFGDFVEKTKYEASGSCTLSMDLTYKVVPGTDWRNPGFTQTDSDPVVCVSKQDAEAYIAWLNTKLHNQSSATGRGPYHLPSEAEWEYAARAGTQTAYWWGDSIGSNKTVCNGCGSRWDKKQTAPVGSFKANPFGLFDMLGDVGEFTADCWDQSYVRAPTDGSARIVSACQKFVVRGSDWANDPWTLRSSDRQRASPEDRGNYRGFRLSKEIN